jgi:polyhydroxyalkanoate synthesis regulator phasin
MIELIKKAVLTGVGIASLTKDKIEDLAKELVVKGKMSEQEGEKLVQEILNRAEESRTTINNQTENLVRKTITKMQLARSEDIELLKAEVEKLREEIASLQSASLKNKAE